MININGRIKTKDPGDTEFFFDKPLRLLSNESYEFFNTAYLYNDRHGV